LFEIRFLFYNKKRPHPLYGNVWITKKNVPPLMEMSGSASDPIASCTLHVPEFLRGLHLIRRDFLLWYRLYLHSNPPLSVFSLENGCTSGVSHRNWLCLPRLQIQLAGSVIMCMFLYLMIDVKHPNKTVLNTQWFVIYVCSWRHSWLHILWVVLNIKMKLSFIHSDLLYTCAL